MENTRIKWEIEEAEEEFKGLQARRTTQLPYKQNLNYVEEDQDEINGGLSAVSNEDSDYKQKNVDNNGEVDECLASESSEELRSSDNGEIEVSEEAEIIEEVDPKSSEKCVYYNQTYKGTESTNGISSNGHSSIEHTIAENIHNNNVSEVAITSSDIEDCLSEESKLEQEKQLIHSSLSGPDLLPSEISPEENDKSFDFYSNNPIESSDTNILYVRDHETMELDVESVLRKQETHDLYCPNCNSCITKRVIIRKRKRRLPNSGEDGKRNKLENIAESHLIPTSVATTSNPSQSTVDTCLDGSGAPVSDKYDQDQEPDVFRCLSCFSIFVPTGNGFKLFPMFGDRSDKDNPEDPPQTPVPKKSWFSTLFQSDKRVTVREDVVAIDSEVLPSNSMRQNGKVSLTQESSSTSRLDLDGEPVKTEIEESAKGANNRSSPQKVSLAEPGSLDDIKVTINMDKQNGEASVNQAPSHADGEIIPNDLTGSKEGSDKVLSPSKKFTGYDTNLVGGGKFSNSSTENISMKQSDATSKLLESLKFPKEVPLNNEAEHSEISLAGSPPTTATEAAEVSTFIPQENGLKFFLPSGVSSFTVGPTKIDQQVNVMIPDKTSVGDITVIADNGHVQSSAAQRLHDFTEPAETGNLQHLETRVLINERAETGNLQHLETRVLINERSAMPTRGIQGPEIIKSIVYGGLVESITSLGVVSSAAGSDATTLHVLALGLANLIGGLIIIGHNVWELKNDKKTEDSEQLVERVDRYHELLGNRRNFLLHAVFAILSFLTFGLIPPVIYGFSFRESDDRNLKLATVAAASLIGIMILAAGKAHVRKEPKSYLKTVSYYIMMGLMVSGVSYAAGNLINMFLEKLGFLQSGLMITLPGMESMIPSWSSY